MIGKETLAALSEHYGITNDCFPEDWEQTDIGVDADACRKELEILGIHGDVLTHLSDTIVTLIHLVRRNPMLDDGKSGQTLRNAMIRRDWLRIYAFFADILPGAEITLRCGRRSVRLCNYADWIREDWIGPALKREIPDIRNGKQARDELQKGRPGRGRRAKDARIPILLWGTYSLITSRHSFPTPMPNALCEFLILMLQKMDILPENTDIDSLWVRAELRYIRSRRVKPRFPLGISPA